MQEQALIQHDNGNGGEVIEKLILHGNLNGLNPMEKIQYYKMYCEHVGLDPSTQPFKILRFQGKEILYCDRSGAQQLNRKHGVSHEIKSREFYEGIYIVTARASLPDGRHEESIGAVNVQGLKGDQLCNALMKAETKSKRRSTLDLLGLGILDETETETIPNARPISPQQIEHEVQQNNTAQKIRELLKSDIFSEEEREQGLRYIESGKNHQKFIERLEYILQERTHTSGPADESETNGEPEAQNSPQGWEPPDSRVLEAIQHQIDRLKGVMSFAATAEQSAQYADGQAYYQEMDQARKYKSQANDLTRKINQEIGRFLPPEDTEEYQEALLSFQEAFNLNEPKTINHFFHMISYLVLDT
ncbi:MAG: hypothetical protein HQK65_22960 [Desulfamplus sp.]|nr:hypothetical protein [Desulfamplus sp.]